VNWFKKLFGLADEKQPQQVKVGSPRGPASRPVPEVTEAVAKQISTENIRHYCDRLEREANRTGNARLRQQSRNIRARLLS
jgi:hypothetical protein